MSPAMRVVRIVFLLACLFIPLLVHAQAPVKPWADWSSYGTAVGNPGAAAVDAWRSDRRGCNLARLALSEGVGNGITLWAKRTYDSPRPCLGCAPDGMPSGHTMNSVIGSSQWGGGLKPWQHYLIAGGLVAATGWLRHDANRHTWRQIAAGAVLGVGAEAAGHLITCRTN
jgi:membrane-associated phospholipid phosphatase